MRCADCGAADAHRVEYHYGDLIDAVWLCDRCDADPDERRARDADDADAG
jgi:hypothetical protein